MAFFLRQKISGGKFSNYRILLSMFFSEASDAFVNDVRKKLDPLAVTETPHLIIIQPITCLRLFEYAFDTLKDDAGQPDAEVELRIFKAILVINQQNAEQQHAGSESTKNLDDQLRLAAMSLASI